METNHQPLRNRRLTAGPGSYIPARSGAPVVDAGSGAGLMLDIPTLLRKYILLALMSLLVGSALGFVAVAFVSPVYRAKARLEVQPLNSGVLKMPTIESDSGQVDLQTEAQIIVSTTFLQKATQRLQFESVLPKPVQNDIFSKLRHRLRPNADEDGVENLSIDGLDMDRAPKALATALNSLDAHQIERTRILEITCDSTNPQFAANFLNAIANEYIQQNQQNFSQTVQSTRQWLSQQLDESKAKMLEAETRLQQYVQTSGNLFASHDDTLAESQLRDFQERLSSAEGDLIAKQTRYEAVKKSNPEALPDVLDDVTVSAYRQKIAELRREEAPLLTTLTPEHPRVKKIESQVAELQSAQKKAVDSAVARITSEYESAKRNRDLLTKAYSTEAGRVTAQAGKQAEYSALKRESESARQTYNNLLIQSNQAGIIGSVPVNNVWLVDPSIPPQKPAKPKPPLIIAIGAALGLGLCCGIVFLRERLNQRVTSPDHARQMFNLPQLGVIPSLERPKIRKRLLTTLGGGSVVPQDLAVPAFGASNLSAELVASGTPLHAESFRVTLASLMRGQMGTQPQVILVTSPGPEEGKTTITCNLGRALAETGRRVLVIDADFRRPRVHKVFGLPNAVGIVDLLSETTPIREYRRDALGFPTSISNLLLLPNGSRSENIPKALYSPRLRELIQRLREEFDTILIDTSPMLHIADARIMSEVVDGVVLVLRSGVTAKDTVMTALDQLNADHVVILGTLLNDWKPTKSTAKYNAYYTTFESYDRG